MSEKKVTLSSPWAIYFRQVQSLFKEDPGVKVVLDDDKPELKIYVEDAEKAEALKQLMPSKKDYGNVVLPVTIIPANEVGESLATIFEKAFKGNGAFVEIIHSDRLHQDFVMFKKEVVQYFNDDLTDANGICSTLYQDLAKEVFEDQGARIFFCTEVEDNKKSNKSLGSPLGEWP